MSTIGSRIRERREELGISQEELAQKLGYRSRSSINKIELDQRDLPQSKIKAIADMLSTTPAYIMGWEDTPSPKDSTDIFSIPGILPLPKMVQKPLIGTIACGTPILAEQNIDSYIPVPDDIRCDFALRCEGDSMIGAHIMPGASVYIREQPDVENGEIAAVIIEDERATLKRVYKTDNAVTLMAENSSYAPIIITGEQLQHMRILGRVVAYTNYLL